MNHEPVFLRRIEQLEERVRLLTGLAGVLVALVVIAAARPDTDVLRARGLVISDASGRERIVLGAPMREATANSKLAQAVGLAVLDSLGRMQVAVGVDNPLVFASGQTGERVASSAGVTIYDPRNGGERGGLGVFADGRANMCLDWGTRAKEAVCVSVAPGDQYTAVMLYGTPDQPQFDRVGLFASADGRGVVKAFGGHANNGGVSINVGKGMPVIAVYDTAGKQIRDALAVP